MKRARSAKDLPNWVELREEMVRAQLEARGIRQEAVLHAMRTVPRHEFVPEAYRSRAYEDSPLPIGHDQTISQPYIVALMSELLELHPGQRVLEIGAGCGYQSAVLAALGARVHALEIVRPLYTRARETLTRLGYDSVDLRYGDGRGGWPEFPSGTAGFDAILVAAAPHEVPPVLLEQLGPKGRLVIPVGDAHQELWVFRRTSEGLERRRITSVRFVPLTGQDPP